MTRLHDIARYGRTVRHLDPGQVAWRVRYALDRRGLKRRVPDWKAGGQLDPAVLVRVREYLCRCARHDPLAPGRLDTLRRNEAHFMGIAADLSVPVDWRRGGVPRLWRYLLHYFDYARDLARADLYEPDASDAARLRAWLDDWITGNATGESPGWDAFVIAARLMNWIQALAVLPVASLRIVKSLATQAAYLSRHIEHDVRANHLLKDAQALIVAGMALGRATGAGREALRAGLPLLERELAEQVLDDGGHYERSPMYHVQVLRDLVLVHAALESPPGFVVEAIARMTTFLKRVLHDDGGIPLFGDAVLDDGGRPEGLIAVACEQCGLDAPARPGACYALAPSGYYVLTTSNGRGRLIAKAGMPGPRYQLGHAHSDMLSFELSVGRQRFIVDAGVREYEPGPWREYCRSTRAHNTVMVDGREQIECWHGFRVGRRYAPGQIRFESSGESPMLEASHDGFLPFTHERVIVLHQGRFWLVIERIGGPRTCRVQDFVHFHPEVALQRGDEEWVAQRGREAVTVVPFGVDRVARACGTEGPHQGWYCPAFGRALPAECLILEKRATCPDALGYAIFPENVDVLRSSQLHELAAAYLGNRA